MANIQSTGIAGNRALQIDLATATLLEGLICPASRVVTIATNTTLTKAHQGKILVCTTGALSLTVDNSTDFDDYESCMIINETGGTVTVVNTATVNIVAGMTRVIPISGIATLLKNTADDTYALFGNLTAS